MTLRFGDHQADIISTVMSRQTYSVVIWITLEEVIVQISWANVKLLFIYLFFVRVQ